MFSFRTARIFVALCFSCCFLLLIGCVGGGLPSVVHVREEVEQITRQCILTTRRDSSILDAFPRAASFARSGPVFILRCVHRIEWRRGVKPKG
jgi:hypothetical protein